MTGKALEKITVDRESATLSSIIWKRFARPMPGILDTIYSLNPRLSRHGEYLPRGTEVIIPVPDESEEELRLDTVTLWE